MQSLSVPGWALPTVRAALAALWAYEGLWIKVIQRDPHELRIVEGASARLGVPGGSLMTAIGLAEGALAILILSGWRTRLVAYIQGTALLTMNLMGILMGKGEITDPVGLLVHNLPTFACIAVLAALGGADRDRSRG